MKFYSNTDKRRAQFKHARERSHRCTACNHEAVLNPSGLCAECEALAPSVHDLAAKLAAKWRA